ncbi:hypothetical protein [Azohydromonas sediminis]|uniref:hypothetical protein n=1 Tax=Azohydromonas sediminis TaxID=2259674 RepID=UPI0013C2A835|nr:hypothetical protein [Azohydromonas sediminis]
MRMPSMGWLGALVLALVALLLALVLAVVVTAALAVDAAPAVAARDDVSPADVDRAVALLRRHDPREAPPRALRWLALGERDLDLLAGHAAQRALGAHARVQLHGGAQPARATVRASVPLPGARWLNVELQWRQAGAWPVLERVRVGRVPVPPALALAAARWLAASRGLPADEVLRALDDVERVVITPQRVVVGYRPAADTLARLRAALVTSAQQARLRAHAERLAAVASGVRGDEVSLAALLPPLFALAAQRSAGGGAGDAAAEHLAALLVLALYATQRPLSLWVPGADVWPAARPLAVTLHGRHDWALHFLVSAVVAAEAGTPLADAVGLWKEIDDARGGSGFSFADLAADRAGTRFGELAVREPLRVRDALLRGATDADLMPDARDLPEFLTDAQFRRRFGGVGAPAYERLREAIETRLAALPLYR